MVCPLLLLAKSVNKYLFDPIYWQLTPVKSFISFSPWSLLNMMVLDPNSIFGTLTYRDSSVEIHELPNIIA